MKEKFATSLIVCITLFFVTLFTAVFSQDQKEKIQEPEIIGTGKVINEDDPKFKNNIINAKVALKYINNYVVRPGGTFSFNAVVGPRTIKRNFVYGLSLVGNKYVKDLGGGVCRASTALHRAVLDAGLKVRELHHHSEKVPYAEKDPDAAVWWGKWDYKFVNSLQNPIKIITEIGEDNVLIVKIIKLPVVNKGKDK